MADQSALFISLKDRLACLESTFLQSQIDGELADPLNFTPDLDQLAAFRFLVHAEIEDYLERKALESITKLKQSTTRENLSIKSNIELFLLANVFETTLQIKTPHDAKHFHDSVVRLVTDLEKFVSNNNGIKEGSFVKLSLICGRMADEMDVALISMLNKYGKERGDIAHQSVSRVRTLQAPSTEKSNASSLVTALGDFFYA